MTKWQAFAKAKGIAPKEKKDKMVYDEEKQEWVPRWGFKGKNRDAEGQWLHEVKPTAGAFALSPLIRSLLDPETGRRLMRCLDCVPQTPTLTPAPPLAPNAKPARLRTNRSASPTCNARLQTRRSRLSSRLRSRPSARSARATSSAR